MKNNEQPRLMTQDEVDSAKLGTIAYCESVCVYFDTDPKEPEYRGIDQMINVGNGNWYPVNGESVTWVEVAELVKPESGGNGLYMRRMWASEPTEEIAASTPWHIGHCTINVGIIDEEEAEA